MAPMENLGDTKNTDKKNKKKKFRLLFYLHNAIKKKSGLGCLLVFFSLSF